MSLIRVPEHTPADLAAWAALERGDAVWARSRTLSHRTQDALDAIERFAASGPCYVGVSWGKDSTVLSHLVWTLATERGLALPLAWVRVEPIVNPHCGLVRDAFLERYPCPGYLEVETWCRLDGEGWHATGTLEAGFAEVTRRLGLDRERYVSGIRGDESAARKRRMRDHGCSSRWTCAPLGRWTATDVYGYLRAYDLPVHPSYAMSLGGRLDRARLRVASLGGQRGDGFGRGAWERIYYPRALERIERLRKERRPA